MPEMNSKNLLESWSTLLKKVERSKQQAEYNSVQLGSRREFCVDLKDAGIKALKSHEMERARKDRSGLIFQSCLNTIRAPRTQVTESGATIKQTKLGSGESATKLINYKTIYGEDEECELDEGVPEYRQN